MKKNEIQFQVKPIALPRVVMGLIRSLYKELAENDLGKTLLVGKYYEHNPDSTWTIENLDEFHEVHIKETDHAIHVLFVNIQNQKK